MSNKDISKLIQAVKEKIIAFLQKYPNTTAMVREFKSREFQNDFKTIVSSNLPSSTIVLAKKLHDPNAPQKPFSGYILFCAAVREEAKNSGLDAIPIAELGARWKALSEEDQNMYKQMAEQARTKYKEEMKHYVPTPVETLLALPENKRKITKTNPRPKRDPNLPVGPRSAYVWFCNHRRPQAIEALTNENGDKPEAKAVRELLSKWWEDCEKQEELYWKQQADADKVRYNKAMQEKGLPIPQRKSKKAQVQPPEPPAQEEEEQEDQEQEEEQEEEQDSPPPPLLPKALPAPPKGPLPKPSLPAPPKGPLPKPSLPAPPKGSLPAPPKSSLPAPPKGKTVPINKPPKKNVTAAFV